MVGTWSGQHTYKDKSSDSYQATHYPTGLIVINFTETDKDGKVTKEQHKGRWVCQGSVFQTDVTTSSDERVTFSYKILQIDSKHMKYQNFSSKRLGPIFEANKVQRTGSTGGVRSCVLLFRQPCT